MVAISCDNMQMLLYFKGTVSRDFCKWFFASISFTPAPEYPLWTVSNFSKIRGDIPRSMLKRKKIFNQKTLIILSGHIWIVEVTHIYIFASKFTLRYLHPDNNPLVCHWRFAEIFTGQG